LSGSRVNRRSFIVGAAGTAAAGLFACTHSNKADNARTAVDRSDPTPADCPAIDAADGSRPLWQTAFQRGIVYGSSTATWQLSDANYRKLFERQAAILFTEDDLLWYRLRPTPQSELVSGTAIKSLGSQNATTCSCLGLTSSGTAVFGEGWTDDDLWAMNQRQARDLMLGTIDSVVGRYRGRVAAWIVVNEALDGSGLRSDVPWYATLGPSYVNESFQAASEADPDALLVLNEFGSDTDDGFASAVDKRAATLQVLDELHDADVRSMRSAYRRTCVPAISRTRSTQMDTGEPGRGRGSGTKDPDHRNGHPRRWSSLVNQRARSPNSKRGRKFSRRRTR
jgi:endo-1,4-beta-xylanase